MRKDVKFALHQITWGNELLRFLDDAAALGAFSGVETFSSVVNEYRGKEKQFDAELAARGLRLAALYGGGPLHEEAQARKVIEHNLELARFLRDRGADRLVFGPPACRDGEILNRDDFRRLADRLNDLGAQTRKMGILLGIHPHLGTIIESEIDLALIMGMTAPECVYFAPDCAHLAGAGINPADVALTYGDRMIYMHLKDLSPPAGHEIPIQPQAGEAKEAHKVEANETSEAKSKASSEPAPIFCELGRGILDFQVIFRTLGDVGYSGWVTLELDSTMLTPSESTRISLEYLRAQFPGMI